MAAAAWPGIMSPCQGMLYRVPSCVGESVVIGWGQLLAGILLQ